MSKPKCEDIGFKHLWEDVTSDVIFAVYPPMSPQKERRCKNCGKHQVLKNIQREINEWQTKE